MSPRDPVVRQLRLVVHAADFEDALAFYRDALGLAERAAFEGAGDARVAILEAGEATLELANDAQVALIDGVETDDGTSDAVRVAFEVDDTEATTLVLERAGAIVEATPRETPWRSRNARLRGPAGLQLTLFEELDHDATARGSSTSADDRRPIGYWLTALDRAIESSFEEAIGTFGLTRRHWQVLHSLHGGGATLDELAEALRPFDADGSEIAESVERLAARGWLDRGEALRLTPEGERGHDAAFDAVARLRERVRDAVSDREYAATVDALRRMTRALDD